MRFPWIAAILSSLLVATCLQISTAYDGELEDDYSDSVLKSLDKNSVLISHSADLDIPSLQSFDDSLYDSASEEQDSSQEANLRAKLLALGKRGWRSPFMMRPLIRQRFKTKNKQASLPQSKVHRRRSQQLSVSGPLSALANMLAAEGRRRKQSEALTNRMRLLELGKRSDELIQPDSFPAEMEDTSNSEGQDAPFLYYSR